MFNASVIARSCPAVIRASCFERVSNTIEPVRRGTAVRLVRIRRVANCEAEQFGTGLEAQLLLDVLAVGFDGLDAQTELVRDLPDRLAGADQAEHFQLAVGQPLHRA